MTTEQQAYELLVRTDHPVFARDFSQTPDIDGNSPFNSIMNLVIAKQVVKLRADMAIVQTNRYPNTVDANGIDEWEETYFAFTKDGEPLSQRRDELLQKVFGKFNMSEPQVVALAEAITGFTPLVIRNFVTGGWVLDQSILDVDTIFSGSGLNSDGSLYAVIFSQSVPSALLNKLDQTLTQIEKAGSRHVILSPTQYWVLDVSALAADTILG